MMGRMMPALAVMEHFQVFCSLMMFLLIPLDWVRIPQISLIRMLQWMDLEMRLQRR